ncbi:hypothetical protein FBUS_09132 [Fasciolopsis buskii]|uniref:BAP29/BAP31 transmembrane domain-containing protein n=1 Tax=Fasciolopsis buskii TaxID=27845 RepID=A0A8E0RTJ3_9TREM|nr:hypothetical protein FBUS_09132 [Fasciolopsis buski]
MLWHLTAGFLYVEIALFVVFLLPIVSTRNWSRLFKLQWVQTITTFSKYYFNLFVMLLFIVFAGKSMISLP